MKLHTKDRKRLFNCYSIMGPMSILKGRSLVMHCIWPSVKDTRMLFSSFMIGANVNAQTMFFENSLNVAAHQGHEEVVRLLFEKRRNEHTE